MKEKHTKIDKILLINMKDILFTRISAMLKNVIICYEIYLTEFQMSRQVKNKAASSSRLIH